MFQVKLEGIFKKNVVMSMRVSFFATANDNTIINFNIISFYLEKPIKLQDNDKKND